MNFYSRAFKRALILHVLLFLALVISMFSEYLFPKKKPEHIFTIVSHVGDPDKPVVQAPPKASPKPMPEVAKPELPPMEEAKPEPEPEPEEAPPPPPKEEPKPRPVEKPKPAPKPIKVQSKPVKPKPEKPAPKEEPKKVTYDPSKYKQKTTPKKETRSSPTKPTTTPVKPVKVDTKRIKEAVSSSVKMDATSGESLTAAQNLALSSFGERLRDRIDAEWQPPQKQLSAMVKIIVSPNGELTATISKGSGDPDFDQSILDAVRAVRMEPPPEGKLRTFYIPISTKEE